MNDITLTLVFVVSVFIEGARPHSWIACTDYVTKNAAQYDVSKCRAWPRAANSRLTRTTAFGLDTGFDHKPSEASPCQAERADGKHYDQSHPMAVYYPGQQVVLAHPMKNHGADRACTNIYIPDSGNFLYAGPRDGAADPTLSVFRQNLIFDLGKSPTGWANSDSSSYPKPGFQNAPAFCDNTNFSLGTYSFNVPRDLSPGRYTFLWIWAFNSDQDLYSTCFEVDIVANKRERNDVLQDRGSSDFSEPCGGDTSNPNIVGNCNRDEVTTEATKSESPTVTVEDGGSQCPTCGSVAASLNTIAALAVLVLHFLGG